MLEQMKFVPAPQTIPAGPIHEYLVSIAPNYSQYLCEGRALSAVSLVSIGCLAQGEAGPCWNATLAFRPSRWAIGESALLPDASEEEAIDLVGVAGSGVAGGGRLGDGGRVYFLFFVWPGFHAGGGTAGCSKIISIN